MRTRLLAAFTSLLLAAGVLVGLTFVTAAPASAATRIEVPTSAAGLGRIVTAPDGTIWFAEEDVAKVGRIVNGQVAGEISFPMQFDTSHVEDIAVAPDSSVWVIYQGGRNIAHLSPTGAVLESGSLPIFGQQVRVAPDGTAYVTIDYDESYVVKIAGGSISEVPNSPECDGPMGMGLNGAMWCQTGNTSITRINPAGGGQSFPASKYASWPYTIAGGPVGQIWYGRFQSGSFAFSPSDGALGYLDANGNPVEFPTGDRTAPNDLVMGPDGSMWFTSIGAAKAIGHVSPNGTGALTQLGGYEPNGLTFGKDGFIYATDAQNNTIIKVAPSELQVTNVEPGDDSIFRLGQGAGPAGVVKAQAPRGVVRARGGKVTVPLTCKKGQDCTGTVDLVTAQKLKAPKGARHALAKGKGKARLVVASATYKIKAGKKKALKIKLTKVGKKVVKSKPLKVRIVVGGKTVGSMTIRR
jgi:virginiamycin B lyase